MVSDAEIAADWERILKEQMSYLQGDIGRLNALREDFPGDWEMQELTRALIFEESQLIGMLRGEIEDGRETLKKLS
jgi:hypothetical protein